MPADDADGLVRLAADWRELAALLDSEARRAAAEVATLQRSWAGAASSAAPAPVLQLVRNTATVTRTLRQGADQLEEVAAVLRRAREEHETSWRKIGLVGAVVVVTAAAVAVSVASAGTAAPGAAAAETAVVGAVAAEMAAASTVALAARAAAARALMALAQTVRAVEAARAIVVPRLILTALQAPVWVETPIGAGVTSGAIAAGLETVDDADGIDWLSVGFTALLGAGEVYAVSPGRSRGFRPLTEKDYARMNKQGTRNEVVRITRLATDQEPRTIMLTSRQARTHYKHAVELGLDPNYNPRHGQAYGTALHEFAARPDTVRIVGRWRGADAVFYADYDSGVTIVTRPNGEFWSLLRLDDRRRWHLWLDHTLGGG